VRPSVGWIHAVAISCLFTVQGRSSAQNAQVPGIPRMVSPGIDVGGLPFSYASQPTDQISVMHAPAGTEITPEGFLYTGYGELMFYVGVDRQPIAARIRTLEDGYLPIVHFDVDHDGVRYAFTMFAASLGPAQDGKRVVNFVRVTAKSLDGASRRAFLTTAWRYQPEQRTGFAVGDNRFQRPVAPKELGDYAQPGAAFRADSAYRSEANAYLQDGRAIYFFPAEPAPSLRPTLKDFYNFQDMTPVGLATTLTPGTPVATAEYELRVSGTLESSLDFKMPLAPVEQSSAEFAAVDAANFDDRRVQVRTFWQKMLAKGIEIETPEAKVNDTFRTSLVNDLMSLNEVNGQLVQTINQLHYHGFYLRDSADFVRMYDTSGYPELGGAVLNFFATKQREDGNFLSQPGQYDGWGEALWTYGEHYRMTHDKAFAAAVYPKFLRAMDWLEPALAKDPLHLVPATDLRDNEFVAGHLTGYNFLALDGLQAAELLAHDFGHSDDEKRFRAIEERLRGALMKQLDKVSNAKGSYIPPCLDPGASGTDWGNLLSVVPEEQLDPMDPHVTATLQRTQAGYQEGLITYHQDGQGTYLHHYLTMKNTQTELIRGEQQQALRELYAVLVHTSSTHAGWEYSIRPWGDRDFSGNLAPHGWFAAEYRNTLRNMLVRERGRTLHLLSAVSPEWAGAGKQILVQKAATYFGEVGFRLTFKDESSAELDLQMDRAGAYAPDSVVMHLPWFVDAGTATAMAHGRQLKIVAGAVEIPRDASRIELHWKRLPLAANDPTSYADAVVSYKAEYKRRYESLTGPMAK